MATCISCDACNPTITYNTLKYCKSCFDQMATMFKKYSIDHEKNVDKTYQPPTKITNNVYIGSLNSVKKEHLTELNIRHIIVAGRDLANENHNGFNVLKLDIDDSFEQELGDSIRSANNFIESVSSDSTCNNVLIHCYSGISRSGSILLGYLIKKNKMSYDEAYDFVKKIYNPIFPNESFQEQLREFAKQN